MSAALLVLVGGLRSLAVAAALLFALLLIGFRALPRAVRPRLARLAVPLSLSAGALLVGWTSWIAGTLLGTGFVLPLAALLFALSLSTAREAIRAALRVGRELFALLARQKALAALLVGLVLLTVPQLLLPLCDSDGTRYHVAFAKLFVLEGHVFPYRWDVTGWYPQTAEMLYLIAYRIGCLQAPSLVHAGLFSASLATPLPI